MNKRIPYGRQHISDEDIVAVSKALKADFLTTGPTNLEFENKFSEYIGCKYAVAVANGTAALHLCAMALDVMKIVELLLHRLHLRLLPIVFVFVVGK